MVLGESEVSSYSINCFRKYALTFDSLNIIIYYLIKEPLVCETNACLNVETVPNGTSILIALISCGDLAVLQIAATYPVSLSCLLSN